MIESKGAPPTAKAAGGSGAGPTRLLAEFAASTTYEQLPDAAIAAAKTIIIDGVANALAGSAEPLAGHIKRYVEALGGSPHCAVAGTALRTNAPTAAFANGVFLHCLDYEVQGIPSSHGTSSILPPILALAEQFKLSGRALLAAFVVGWEVQQRLAVAGLAGNLRGFHPPGVYGPLAAAAAAANILGLNAAETAMAFGIAASGTGGLFANNGTMTKSTHPGGAGRTGVEAALLAADGYGGNNEVLEAEEGYVAAFFGSDFDWPALTEGLGERYNLVERGFNIKRYPAQIYMQWAIEAVATLRERHGLRLEDVNYMEMETPGRRGYVFRPRPKSGLDGKFSFEYCSAVALLRGHLGIDDFTDATRFSPEVEQALEKVRIVKNAEIPTVAPGLWVEARAHLNDGSVVTERCTGYQGSIVNPMSREELYRKFRGCAGRVLPADVVERGIATLEGLEKEPNMDEIVRLISVS